MWSEWAYKHSKKPWKLSAQKKNAIISMLLFKFQFSIDAIDAQWNPSNACYRGSTIYFAAEECVRVCFKRTTNSIYRKNGINGFGSHTIALLSFCRHFASVASTEMWCTHWHSCGQENSGEFTTEYGFLFVKFRNQNGIWEIRTAWARQRKIESNRYIYK